MGEPAQDDRVSAELVAVITAVHDGVPLVLTTRDGRRLPSGPLQSGHRSMQAGLRSWVVRQTGYELGYVEQLYTFADRDRGMSPVLEVSYLGLTTVPHVIEGWRNWFEYFPWEDRRDGDAVVTENLAPALERWATADGPQFRERRRLRCAVTFGLDGHPWLPGMALQRYELLYEAALVPEAPGGPGEAGGRPMDRDHRRILATAIGRLRAKIQYRPVVFELLPPAFTLGRLQGTVEAIAGQHVHKQNFRRLVEQQELVEETGEVDHSTGGRPARLFRFRREVTDERDVAGTKLPVPRPN
ncbi:NrtR DNA-binding winged helix domain-containing protein [Georgenia sp. AZ-5]|uniref:NUDIX hydrolase n=1 Tax=Georgenia sp. AZ-5 TaxID=3367526 RepID=UPI003754C64D